MIFAMWYSGKGAYIFVGVSVIMIGSDIKVGFMGVLLSGGGCIRG